MTYSVRDLAAQIDGDKQLASAMAARIAAAKSNVDQLLDAFHSMGVTGGETYERLVKTGEMLDNAESVRAEVEGGLEKCRFMAMSAITGMYASNRLGGGDSTIVQASLEEAKHIPLVEDPVTAPASSPNDHYAELKDTDENDKTRNKFARGARGAIKRAGDLQKQGEDTAKTSHTAMKDSYRPPDGRTYETVGVPPPVAQDNPGAAKATVHDDTGTLIVMTALVVEWGTRGFNNRRSKK